MNKRLLLTTLAVVLDLDLHHRHTRVTLEFTRTVVVLAVVATHRFASQVVTVCIAPCGAEAPLAFTVLWAFANSAIATFLDLARIFLTLRKHITWQTKAHQCLEDINVSYHKEHGTLWGIASECWSFIIHWKWFRSHTLRRGSTVKLEDFGFLPS